MSTSSPTELATSEGASERRNGAEQQSIDSEVVEPAPSIEALQRFDVVAEQSEEASGEAERFPVLIVRIVLAKGGVLSSQKFKAKLRVQQDGSNRQAELDVHTDTNGYLRLVLNNRYQSGSVRTLSLFALATEDEPMRIAEVDLSMRFPPRDHDLGDLLLASPPVLAQGLVRNSALNPVAEARIDLDYWLDESEIDEGEWVRLPDLHVDTDFTGKFTLRGQVESGRYRLVVNHFDYVSKGQEISLGEIGLELQMLADWDVRGRFLYDPDFDISQFEPVLIGVARDVDGEGAINRCFLEEDGTFWFFNQPEGEVVLELRFKYQEYSIFAKRFHLGGEGRTETLEDIDLRGTIHKIVLDVRDEEGEYPFGLWAATLDGIQIAKSHEEPLVLYTSQLPLDIVVGSMDGRSVLLHGVNSDQEVTLSLGIPVNVVVDNLPDLPEGFWASLVLELVSDANGVALAHRSKLTNLWFGEGCYLPAPGTYGVGFWCSSPDFGATSNISKTTFRSSYEDCPMVEVVDSSELQTFHVSLSPRDIQRFHEFIAVHSQ